MGISVFEAAPASLGENVERMKKGDLKRFNVLAVCQGHGADGGCHH